MPPLSARCNGIGNALLLFDSAIAMFDKSLPGSTDLACA